MKLKYRTKAMGFKVYMYFPLLIEYYECMDGMQRGRSGFDVRAGGFSHLSCIFVLFQYWMMTISKAQVCQELYLIRPRLKSRKRNALGYHHLSRSTGIVREHRLALAMSHAANDSRTVGSDLESGECSGEQDQDDEKQDRNFGTSTCRTGIAGDSSTGTPYATTCRGGGPAQEIHLKGMSIPRACTSSSMRGDHDIVTPSDREQLSGIEHQQADFSGTIFYSRFTENEHGGPTECTGDDARTAPASTARSAHETSQGAKGASILRAEKEFSDVEGYSEGSAFVEGHVCEVRSAVSAVKKWQVDGKEERFEAASNMFLGTRRAENLTRGTPSSSPPFVKTPPSTSQQGSIRGFGESISQPVKPSGPTIENDDAECGILISLHDMRSDYQHKARRLDEEQNPVPPEISVKTGKNYPGSSMMNPLSAGWRLASTASTSSESSPSGAGASSPIRGDEHMLQKEAGVERPTEKCIEILNAVCDDETVLLSSKNNVVDTPRLSSLSSSTGFVESLSSPKGKRVVEQAAAPSTAARRAGELVDNTTSRGIAPNCSAAAEDNEAQPAAAASSPAQPANVSVHLNPREEKPDIREEKPDITPKSPVIRASATPPLHPLDTARASPPNLRRSAIEEHGQGAGSEASYATDSRMHVNYGADDMGFNDHVPAGFHPNLEPSSPFAHVQRPRLGAGLPDDFHPFSSPQQHNPYSSIDGYRHPASRGVPPGIMMMQPPHRDPTLHPGYGLAVLGQTGLPMARFGARAGHTFETSPDGHQHGMFRGRADGYLVFRQNSVPGVLSPGLRPPRLRSSTYHDGRPGEAAAFEERRQSSFAQPTAVENSDGCFRSGMGERATSAPVPTITSHPPGHDAAVDASARSTATAATAAGHDSSTTASPSRIPGSVTPGVLPSSNMEGDHASSGQGIASAGGAKVEEASSGEGMDDAAQAIAKGDSEGEVSRRDNAYNDIGLVVTRTKELEKILKDLFGAVGSGLNEQLTSLRGENRIDRRTQSRIRSIASMRNKLVHSVDANNLTISNTFGHSARRAFKLMVDDLETTLRECAVREPLDLSFEQPAKPPDAYMLGHHPAFRGIAGSGISGSFRESGQGGEDEETEMGGIANANGTSVAAARREPEAIVVKDTARFPHNLIIAKKKPLRRDQSSTAPAPDVTDEATFPAIDFASSVAVPRRRSRHRGASTSEASTAGTGIGEAGVPAGQGGGGSRVSGGLEDDFSSAGWDGEGNIEEAQVISGRGVCRKLGQGEVGYVSTTHTMSGVYRKWDHASRNPVGAWRNDVAGKQRPKPDDMRREVPGAASPSKGQVAFEGRGLGSTRLLPAQQQKQRKFNPTSVSSDSMGIFTSNGMAQRSPPDNRHGYGRPQRGTAIGSGNSPKEEEVKWKAAMSARHRRRCMKDDKAPRHYVIRRQQALRPFWLLPGVQFGRSNCRGWFPTREDWCTRGMPECVYVPLEPSTEDRVAAMQFGTEPLRGLTLEEDEERLMRIAIRESAAESKRAYEKKYGTEKQRQARREAQALERIKAVAERESLERDEEQQLTEVIKASLAEALGPGERDDREVMAAIEASKAEETNAAIPEAEDPAILIAIEESRRQHETRQELMRRQFEDFTAQHMSPPESSQEPTPNAVFPHQTADSSQQQQLQSIHLPVEPTAQSSHAPGLSAMPLAPPVQSGIARNSIPILGNAGVARPSLPVVAPVVDDRARFSGVNVSTAGRSPGALPPRLPAGGGFTDGRPETLTVEDDPVGHVGIAAIPGSAGDSASATAMPSHFSVSAAAGYGTLPQQRLEMERARSLGHCQAASLLVRQPLLAQRATSLEVGGIAGRHCVQAGYIQHGVPSEGLTPFVDHGQAHARPAEEARAIPSGVNGNVSMVSPAQLPRSMVSTPRQAPVPVQQSRENTEGTGVESSIGQTDDLQSAQAFEFPGRHDRTNTGATLRQDQPCHGPAQPDVPRDPQEQRSLDQDGRQSRGPQLAAWAHGRGGVSASEGEVAAVTPAASPISTDEMPTVGEIGNSLEEQQLLQAMEASRHAEATRQKSLSLVEDDDSELQAVMEASRIAELERQQEEMDAKAAMDMALKLSEMDIGGRRSESPQAAQIQQPSPADGRFSPKDVESAPSCHATMVPAHVPIVDDTRDAGAYPTVQVFTAAGDIVTRDVMPYSGPAIGANHGAESGVGEQHDFAQTTTATQSLGLSTMTGLASVGAQETQKHDIVKPSTDEDDVDRQLREAMEEERRYYESQLSGAAVGGSVSLRFGTDNEEDEGFSDDRAAAASTTRGDHPASTHQSIFLDYNDNDHQRSFHGQSIPDPLFAAARENETSTSAADVAPASGTSAGDEAGGDCQGGVDEEIARVMEQSRLEAERQAAARAAATATGENGIGKSEEEMMARVVADSLQEKERRERQQLEFQRAMETSLT